jgi:hypothetical protein
MRYAIVIEKANGNYSAYVPDLPGCVATGETVKAVESEIRRNNRRFQTFALGQGTSIDAFYKGQGGDQGWSAGLCVSTASSRRCSQPPLRC